MKTQQIAMLKPLETYEVSPQKEALRLFKPTQTAFFGNWGIFLHIKTPLGAWY